LSTLIVAFIAMTGCHSSSNLKAVNPTIVAEYSLPSAFGGEYNFTLGPDGAVWFIPDQSDYIGRFDTTSGHFDQYPLPKIPQSEMHGTANGSSTERRVEEMHGIVVGPDASIWFTEYGAHRIGRITIHGEITEYRLSDQNFPYGIAVGPDQALWFTNHGGNAIGRITTAGSVTEFPLSTDKATPASIVAGPDGNLWFTEILPARIGRMTTTGEFTDFSVGEAGQLGETPLLPCGDSGLWFVAGAQGSHAPFAWDYGVGRISLAGKSDYFPLPSPPTPEPAAPCRSCVQSRLLVGSFPQPFGLAACDEGAVWYWIGEKVFGRVTSDGQVEQSLLTASNAETGSQTAAERRIIWYVVGGKLRKVAL